MLLPLAVIQPAIFNRFLGNAATRPKLAGLLIAYFFICIIIGAALSPETYEQARTDAEMSKQAAQEAQNASQVKKKQEVLKKQAELYEVVSVVDGDTIKVNYKDNVETVRLVGVDTPETKHPSKPVECFGKEASAYMTKLVGGRKVRLEEDSTQSSRDKYGRLLRFVLLEDDTNINEKMIRDGYAFEYTYQSNPYKYQKLFKAAQKEARENDEGLWSSKTCDGKQEPVKKAQPKTTPPVSTPKKSSQPKQSSNSSSGVVKKSTSGICHAPGTTYYNRTTNFTAYKSVDACLNSGGRLPLR